MNIFGPKARETQIKYTWFHRFKAFQAVFPVENLLLLSASIPNINKIDCRTNKSMKAHIYISLIFRKSLTVGNIAIREDLNIDEISIKKTDP